MYRWWCRGFTNEHSMYIVYIRVFVFGNFHLQRCILFGIQVWWWKEKEMNWIECAIELNDQVMCLWTTPTSPPHHSSINSRQNRLLFFFFILWYHEIETLDKHIRMLCMKCKYIVLEPTKTNRRNNGINNSIFMSLNFGMEQNNAKETTRRRRRVVEKKWAIHLPIHPFIQPASQPARTAWKRKSLSR